MLAQRPRPTFTGATGDGSRTITIHDVPTSEGNHDDDDLPDFTSHPRPVLRLRGGPRSARRVAWTAEVIDNEGQGKKKSKICCIYHKPKRFDESSDESSGESDDGRAKPSSSSKRKAKPHHHHHDHDHGHDSGDQSSSSSSSNSSTPDSSTQQPTVSATTTELQQPRNAYESLPRRGNDGESEVKP